MLAAVILSQEHEMKTSLFCALAALLFTAAWLSAQEKPAASPHRPSPWSSPAA
jgi:hypothetical protein